jgi:hypothetical protein
MDKAQINNEVNVDREIVAHTFRRLRSGMHDKPKFQAVAKSILQKHGATSLDSLDPKYFDAVTFEARVALGLHLSSIGKVFPVKQHGKRPAISKNLESATQDPVQIRQWVEQHPDCNWGITANVVDVDSKQPKAPQMQTGIDTWGALIMEHESVALDVATLQVGTPTGGKHVYLLDQLPTGTNVLGDGVDTRGAGTGYVVAAGSYVVANKSENIERTGFYEVLNDLAIAPAPDWIKQRAKARPKIEREEVGAAPMYDLEKSAEMLNALDPAQYREQGAWFELMCSYHYLTGGHGGVDFEVWSLSDEGYAGNQDNIEDRWNSLKRHDKGDKDHRHFLNEVNKVRPDLVTAAVAAIDFGDVAEEFADAANDNAGNESKSETDSDSTKPKQPVISFTRYKHQEPHTLEPRDVLGFGHYLRKYISADIAPGGSGKTSHAMVEAVAMATGLDLLRTGRMYYRPLVVWYWNGEDPIEEVKLRLAAIVKLYGEKDNDDPGRPVIDAAAIKLLEQNLFIDSGRELVIRIATDSKTGTTMHKPLVEALVAEVQAKSVDVVVIDPFISSHAVSENDNNAIDLVVKSGWVRVANEGKCAVNLCHHARKGTGGAVSASDARGASALVDAARSVRVLNPIQSESEAETFGIVGDWSDIFRVSFGKGNTQRKGSGSVFRLFVDVDLGNARVFPWVGKMVEIPSDHVGVVVNYRPPAKTADDPLFEQVKGDSIVGVAVEMLKAGQQLTYDRGPHKLKDKLGVFGNKLGRKVTLQEVRTALQSAVNAGFLGYRNYDKKRHDLGAGYYLIDQEKPAGASAAEEPTSASADSDEPAGA